MDESTAAAAPDAFADNPSLSSAPQREGDSRDTQTYREHLEHVTKLTYPIVLSEIFQNLLPVVDIAFVGRLGKEELAAAALATVWFNLASRSVATRSVTHQRLTSCAVYSSGTPPSWVF